MMTDRRLEEAINFQLHSSISLVREKEIVKIERKKINVAEHQRKR